MNLRQKLIRLAHTKPQLRGYLLPLLKQSAMLESDTLSLALRKILDNGYFPGFTGNLQKLWSKRVGLLLNVIVRERFVRQATIELLRLKKSASDARKEYNSSPLVTPDFFTETLEEQRERMREEMPEHADSFNWGVVEKQRDNLVALVEEAESKYL